MLNFSKELRIQFGERLQVFIDSCNISKEELAGVTGVTRQTVRNLLLGRYAVSSDFLVTFTNVYPEVNINWLLSGKGKMILKYENNTIDKRAEYPPDSLIEIIESKDATILAQQKSIRELDELVNALKDNINLLEEKLGDSQKD